MTKPGIFLAPLAMLRKLFVIPFIVNNNNLRGVDEEDHRAQRRRCGHYGRTEVIYYEPAVIDRLNSAPGGRSAQPRLSLVWLYSLGPRRGADDYGPYSASHRPTLTGTDQPWLAGLSRRPIVAERYYLIDNAARRRKTNTMRPHARSPR